MKMTKIIAPVLALFVLVSCKKNGSSTFTYQVRTVNSSAVVNSAHSSGFDGTARVQGGQLQWTSGYASVVELEFEAEREGLEVEYQSEARKKIDLFSTLSTLGVVGVPPGTYDEIEFQMEVQPSGNDAALHLEGTYTSGGVSTPIVFELNAALEIEAEKANYTVAGDESYTALTSLDLSLALTGVTDAMLANATRTNGAIVITATSNADIYAIIYNNLRNCGGVEVED